MFEGKKEEEEEKKRENEEELVNDTLTSLGKVLSKYAFKSIFRYDSRWTLLQKEGEEEKEEDKEKKRKKNRKKIVMIVDQANHQNGSGFFHHDFCYVFL